MFDSLSLPKLIALLTYHIAAMVMRWDCPLPMSLARLPIVMVRHESGRKIFHCYKK